MSAAFTERALPTAALTLSRVPPPEASADETGAFALTLDGYEEAGGSGPLAALVRRWSSGDADALSLHELRLALFFLQRADHHMGGYEGNWEEMREVADVIRERVIARGPGVGLWRGDITRLDVDAVVNAANKTLAGGGGVDGAIHRAAGPELVLACMEIPEIAPAVRCPTGSARITPGFGFHARHVVHAVGPVWHGGDRGEARALDSAYRAALGLAWGAGAESVAFPALSAGAYGYPVHEASGVAVRACRAWLRETGAALRVVLVAFDAKAEKALARALG